MSRTKRVVVELELAKSGGIDEVTLMREFIAAHIGAVGTKMPWHGLISMRVLEQEESNELPMSMDKALVIIMGASQDWAHGDMESTKFKKVMKEVLVAFATPTVEPVNENIQERITDVCAALAALLSGTGWDLAPKVLNTAGFMGELTDRKLEFGGDVRAILDVLLTFMNQVSDGLVDPSTGLDKVDMPWVVKQLKDIVGFAAPEMWPKHIKDLIETLEE